jgi:hypothetical protein
MMAGGVAPVERRLALDIFRHSPCDGENQK